MVVLAAAGAAADQDVRGGVDVDGDGPTVGADADQCGGVCQGLKLFAQTGVGEAQQLRERGRGRHRGGVLLSAVPGEPGVHQDWGIV